MKDNKDNTVKWYDNGSIITTLIIIVISSIIVFSQSFALGKITSFGLFTSIINHNSIYLSILVYFIIVKLPAGKRYFNYLSVFIIFIYFIMATTSLLTLIQSFSLNTLLEFLLNFLMLMYLIHALLKDTRVWREFYLSKSPINDINNEIMFYTIGVVTIILLAVNLINTIVISGVIISILETIFILLFSRYIYLYREYLERKKNNMSLDDIKKTLKEVDKKVSDTVDDIGKRVNDFVEEKEIEKKIDKAKERVVDTTKELEKQMTELADDVKKDIKKRKTTTKKGDK